MIEESRGDRGKDRGGRGEDQEGKDGEKRDVTNRKGESKSTNIKGGARVGDYDNFTLTTGEENCKAQ